MGEPMSKEEVVAYSADTFARLRRAGVKYVRVLGCGNPGQVCEACEALEGKVMGIDEFPGLPLPGCDQEYCRCVFGAVLGPNGNQMNGGG
jgi:hypothetical protein